MSDHPEAAKPKAGVLTWALRGVALIGVAAVVYIIAQASLKPEQAHGSLEGLDQGAMGKLEILDEPAAAPAYAFQDGAGAPVKIADFKGKVAVVNLWATWCAPCVIEMPTLAKLAAHYEGKDVAVVAVSVDSDSAVDKAKLFIAKNAPLTYYADPAMKLPFSFSPPAAGMPTTVIYGKDGRERARLAGEADWSGEDAKKLIDALLAE